MTLLVLNRDELENTKADYRTDNFRSIRIVRAKEKVGFSVHETIMYAGTVNDFWYANHVEAVFVYDGWGEITNKDTGETYALRPGSVYLLNNHDRHQVRPKTDMRTVCVFRPPLSGEEKHDERGTFPLMEEEEDTGGSQPA
jgi:L-ectoine synthase